MHYRGKYRHYGGNRHYSAYCQYWLFPSVRSDFTGTVAGNRHYSTGTIQGSLLHLTSEGVLDAKTPPPPCLCRRRSTTPSRFAKPPCWRFTTTSRATILPFCATTRDQVGCGARRGEGGGSVGGERGKDKRWHRSNHMYTCTPWFLQGFSVYTPAFLDD